MNGFAKFLVWAIILALVGYFGYQAYVKWWDADAVKSKTQNIGGTMASSTAKAGEKIGEVAGTVKKKTEEYANQVVGEAKEGAMDFVKRKIGEGVAAIGGGIANMGDSLAGKAQEQNIKAASIQNIVQNYYQGSASSSGNQVPQPESPPYFNPPSVTSIIAGQNVPLIFSINSNVTYQVDWGDGVKESGEETSGNVKLVSHAWKDKGDYNVKIVIRVGTSSNEYSFPIRVY